MDKISTIKENILYFIEKQGISKSLFYEISGISASNFKGSGLKSEIGGDKIVKILTLFPDLNSEWLLTGKGSMLKSNDIASNDNTRDDQLLRENDMQAKIIAGLEFKIVTLEKEIFNLKIESNLSVPEGTVEFHTMSSIEPFPGK